MILHCPCCHSRFSIEVLAQDEAARELLALRLSPTMLAYLSLFRSEARALPFDRALKLAKEVGEIQGPGTGDRERLEAAMVETVEALRAKGNGKPLKNHNYLKRVLENQPVPCAGTSPLGPQSGSQSPTPRLSRRREAMNLLNEWAGEDWLRIQVALGMSALVAAGLDNTPAMDTITRTADIWELTLKKAGLKHEHLDARRLQDAFAALLTKADKWPEPKTLKEHLPRRPEQKQLAHAELTEADRQAALDRLKNL